jgi:glycosyltransferase involved in cell wall biosynthesis
MGLFRGRKDEPLITPPAVEWPSLMSLDYNELRRIVHELIAWTQPDVVHVHHFAHWSLDLLEILYELDKRVVFTFHEYMAICQNLGQMVKTNKRLCEQSSPAECGACFPDFTPGQFFLRDQIFRTYLQYCNYFIAPSQFLLDRYTSWGLDPSAAEVIENPISPKILDRCAKREFDTPMRNGQHNSGRMRLGFFGQINGFKGVDVLLNAASLLSEDVRASVEIGIHGANLEMQEEGFRSEILALLAANKDVVTVYGPYENHQVMPLMSGYDWIVVPSIWWENSPVVIQEAHLVGKPVLCARIGGMAEKVSEGVTGRYFDPSNPSDLARKITQIVEQHATFDIDVAPLMSRHARAIERHVEIYQRIVA